MDNSATLTQPVSANDHAEGTADAPLTLVSPSGMVETPRLEAKESFV